MPTRTDFSRHLRERLAALREQIGGLEREVSQVDTSAAAGGGSDPADRLATLRDEQRQILRSASASTALNLLLTLTVRHGRRAVLFILRKGELWAWSGLGEGGERLPLSRFTVSLDESPLLTGALQSQQTRRGPASEPWTARLPGAAGAAAAAIPLAGGERAGAVLWLETEEAAASGTIEMAECLAAVTGAALELVARRRPGAAPAGRITADERALGAALPYALGDEPPADAAAPGAAALPGSVSAAPGPDLGRQHEDARRLARLLVSEIKLYNEDKVVLGRKARDLYSRLRDDIERSRQTYNERVADEVRSSADYFQQELVATLADGDESLLGPISAGA
jgi:molybdopterin converting factor small subunit